MRRHSDLARPPAALVASLLAGAALAASGVAVAGISDSPPTTPSTSTSTSTDPVSTVTLLPPPKTTPSPRPDPFPTQTHKSAPRPTAPPTTKPSPAPAPTNRPLAPTAAPAAAPTSSTGPAASTKRLRARNTHTTRRHETRNAIKPHSGAATHAPRKRTPESPATPHPTAAAPLGNAAPNGNSHWIALSAVAAFALLLLAAGLATTVKDMRKTPAMVADVAVRPQARPSGSPKASPQAPEASTVPVAPRAEQWAAVALAEAENSPSTPAESTVSPDSCQIIWWRGYLRSRFVAEAWDETDGIWTLIAESTSFSWRSGEPPPKSPSARAAYSELVQLLDDRGWEPDGSGDAWFEMRFRHAADSTSHAALNDPSPSTSSIPAL